MYRILLAGMLLALGPRGALAHCPLCTIGAVGAAVLAAYLGISAAPVGVFVGAFGLAVGLWTAKLIRRKFFRGQDNAVGVVSFASVVLPVMPLMDQYGALYLPWIGEYGRTFLIDKFLTGAVVGALLLWAAPWLSRRVALARGGRMVPFQGIAITLVILLVASAVLEVSL